MVIFWLKFATVSTVWILFDKVIKQWNNAPYRFFLQSSLKQGTIMEIFKQQQGVRKCFILESRIRGTKPLASHKFGESIAKCKHASFLVILTQNCLLLRHNCLFLSLKCFMLWNNFMHFLGTFFLSLWHVCKVWHPVFFDNQASDVQSLYYRQSCYKRINKRSSQLDSSLGKVV